MPGLSQLPIKRLCTFLSVLLPVYFHGALAEQLKRLPVTQEITGANPVRLAILLPLFSSRQFQPLKEPGAVPPIIHDLTTLRAEWSGLSC
jgi:hypothetical protein